MLPDVVLTKEKKAKYAYHSIKSDADIYHLCENCTIGNNIEPENRRSGTGGKTTCDECKDKIKNLDCRDKCDNQILKEQRFQVGIFDNLRDRGFK